MALGAIGDAYVQIDDLEKAAKYYMDAANKNENDLLFCKKILTKIDYSCVYKLK